MAQLYSTVNPRQPSTLPRNTVQDPKNDGHSMTVTTQGDNKIIDPPMPSGVEDYIRGDDVVEEVNGELVEKSGKEAEIPQKVTSIPRPPPTLPQRLVNKTEDGKYQRFISMLKQLSINVPFIEALEQMPGYAMFMKYMVTKKRSDSFEDNDWMQNCSAIATRSLVQKKEDSGSFTFPCTIGLLYFAKALCDLRASINFMPLSLYKKMVFGDPQLTVFTYGLSNGEEAYWDTP
ncbi:uncharacterized protein [Solanum lycopersicum]|uniref:uncharacterized protein n=1 Tax=Solanum lycopersicum TaxID=4081 RepID=UPI00374A53DE